jgi:hypothetical protein
MKKDSRRIRSSGAGLLALGIASVSCLSASPEVEAMAGRLQAANAELEDLEIWKSEVITIAGLSRDLEERATEVRALEQAMTKKMAQLEAVRGKWVDRERKQAEGEKIATLFLKSGKEYENVVITQVTDVGLGIRTENGTSRIPAEELPVVLQNRFHFRADAALAQIRAEQAALSRHEAEVKAVVGSAQLAADPFVEDPFAGGGQQALAPSLTPGGPGGFDPFGSPEAFPLPNADPAPGVVPPSAPGAPASPRPPATKEKGRVTARPKSYNGSTKLVEFVGHANCAAQVRVHGAIQGDGIFDIQPYVRTEREIWVTSGYTVELISASGVKLDEERTRKKTDLGHSELER